MKVKLTGSQHYWLKRMEERGQLSDMFDKPPLRVMNNLASKGLCKNIMNTFFEITEEGIEWLNQQRQP